MLFSGYRITDYNKAGDKKGTMVKNLFDFSLVQENTFRIPFPREPVELNATCCKKADRLLEYL